VKARVDTWLLVRNQQIAQEASLDPYIEYEGGRMALIGIGAEKGTSQNLEASLLAELKKIQYAVVTAKELEKAKNQLISEVVRERETNDGKAIAIEQAVAYQGDPKAVK
jgi:zinc protease